MPLPELGEIRREQICLSASEVIAEKGFAGSTMRLIADRAGVSTGMLNHYFSSRAEMLVETLVFVSRRMHARCREAINEIPPGEARVRALVRAALPTTPETTICWRTWIAAYGEAVRSDVLRNTIEHRLEPWYDTLALALEGMESSTTRVIPLTWQFDGLLNGLAIQWLTAKPDMDLSQIEEALVGSVRAIPAEVTAR